MSNNIEHRAHFEEKRTDLFCDVAKENHGGIKCIAIIGHGPQLSGAAIARMIAEDKADLIVIDDNKKYDHNVNFTINREQELKRPELMKFAESFAKSPILYVWSKEELNHLGSTLRNVGKKSDHVWIKAFNQYNSNHEKRLSMNCVPCYYKVHDYIINYVRQNSK